MAGGIHPYGGPKKLTAAQQATADRLVGEGVTVYAEKVQGKGVVAAMRRYLETGDSEKITTPLYRFLTLKCGFIAHYDLHGFRHVYRDPADLIAARHDGMTGSRFDDHPRSRPVEHSQSVYTDGLTSVEVYEQMAALVAEKREDVTARSQAQERLREVAQARALAAKHGLTVV
jgi:hypothetical protein